MHAVVRHDAVAGSSAGDEAGFDTVSVEMGLSSRESIHQILF